jgi:hypothetical protein
VVRTVDWIEGYNSSADFNLNPNHVNAATKQASLQIMSIPHHHATHKLKFLQNVPVSLPICEIKI